MSSRAFPPLDVKQRSLAADYRHTGTDYLSHTKDQTVLLALVDP
jgi:hypothetical protein